MATSLGGHDQGIKLMVKSLSTNPIKRGTIVSWASVAANNPAAVFLDGTIPKDYKAGGGAAGVTQLIDIPLITVLPAGADSVNVGGSGRLGVVYADIPPLGNGEIITYGYARVLFGGAVVIGDHMTSNASGFGIDAAATDRNVIGIALETGVNGVLSWCWVNFLMHGGNSAAFFAGKAIA